MRSHMLQPTSLIPSACARLSVAFSLLLRRLHDCEVHLWVGLLTLAHVGFSPTGLSALLGARDRSPYQTCNEGTGQGSCYGGYTVLCYFRIGIKS